MQAFARGDKEAVLSLLPDVSHPHLIRDWRSSTLLHHAASRGWADVWLSLVEEYQCNVKDRDSLGLTSMECVTSNNKYEIFSIFASHVDLNMELVVRAFFKLFMAGE